ncbi:hypothetical protein ON010_g14515 [Phytophthora cinnamomi]|nr:hypothetical protein ON010_g14515 [Phytophthora cinnamomi]
MKRALCLIESVALGPTKLEVAFPTEAANGPKKIVPRALLEKRFGGTRREWRDLSQIHSIGGADINQASSEEQVQETQNLVNNGNTDVPPRESPLSRAATGKDSIGVIPACPRQSDVWFCNFQTPTERSDTNNSWPIGRRPPRRKSVRWSAEEEAALIEGYRLYETYSNVWVLIKTKYPNVLHNRSNVDLKDKYRNLVRYGKIPRVDGDGTDNAGVTDNDGTDDNGNAETQTGANDPVAI